MYFLLERLKLLKQYQLVNIIISFFLSWLDENKDVIDGGKVKVFE